MGLRTLSIETLCVLKLDKHSYEVHINLSFICLTLLCLICALSLYLAQKLLRKVKIPQVCKNRKKLLQMPKCAQMLPIVVHLDIWLVRYPYLWDIELSTRRGTPDLQAIRHYFVYFINTIGLLLTRKWTNEWMS